MSRAVILVAVAAMLAGCQSYGGAGRGWHTGMEYPRSTYGSWRAYPYPYGYGIRRPYHSLADQLAYERWMARRHAIDRHRQAGPDRPPAEPPAAGPAPTDEDRAEMLRSIVEQLRQQEHGP